MQATTSKEAASQQMDLRAHMGTIDYRKPYREGSSNVGTTHQCIIEVE